MFLDVQDLERIYAEQGESDWKATSDAIELVRCISTRSTRLKRLRVARGLTQAELSRMSDVSLRSIQQYEQRKKDINKAQAFSVYRLARVLGCQTEELLEPDGTTRDTARIRTSTSQGLG